MAKEFRFNDSKKYGKQGEREVLDFLSKHMIDIKRIEDVSNDPYYQLRDIDAICYFNNGESMTIEIKTDSHATSGNLVYEVWSSFQEQKPGCMYKTECESLFYYFPETGELFQIKMDLYREWVEQHKDQFKIIHTKNTGWGIEYSSMSYLIPKKMLEVSFGKHINCYNVRQT